MSNKNIVKIENPRDLKFPIHDFHIHIDKNIQKNLVGYNKESICIMPSWKTLDSIDFTKAFPNDFTHPDEYLKNLDTIEKFFYNWKAKVFKFIPLDFSKSKDEFREIIEKYNPAGIKLHPLQNFKIDKATLDPYFNIVSKKKLIVYIHSDWVPSTEWKQVKGTMKNTFGKIGQLYPNITFIIGHAGNNDSFVLIWKILKKYPNFYAETSLAPTPQELEKIIYNVGSDRVLFGSNYPFSSTAVEITKIIKMKRVSDLDKKAVFYDNSIKLLKDRPYMEVLK